ncbi:unnamed protein product [Rhizophagus irregularis]|nr:unnamed protein product [Rhizophagus irregularis]
MVENQKALFHVMLMPSRWLHDDALKNIDSIYCEPFINASSQNFSNTNNEQILNPRHYNNVQEVQVHQQVQKKYDDDENNLDDLILSYIAKRVEEREARYQSTTTNEIQPSNNTIKSKDGRVYNVSDIKDPTVRQGKGRPPTKRLKAFNEVHNKVGSTSTSQQINIGCEENEINGRMCHKTGHYAPKCPNKETTNVNG